MELINTSNRSELMSTSGVIAYRYAAILLVSLTMTACTTLNAPVSTKPPTPAPQTTSEDINAIPAEPEPVQRQEIVRPQAEPETPVVIALLQKAEAEQQSGNFDRAAADLERALRIDSRNPRLWQRLAEVRLQQGDARQAEILAGKSNQYASGDTAMKRRNWQIIAKARAQSGDQQGANDAILRAAEF